MNVEEAQKQVKPIQLRVCNILKSWIEMCFADFTLEMISIVEEFCETLKQDGYGSIAEKLENNMATMALGLSRDRKIVFTTTPPPVKVPLKLPENTLDIWEHFLDAYDEEELARQITIIDYDIYAAIKPKELLNQGWTKPALHKQCPNVVAYIVRFNFISSIVVSCIVNPENVKVRARMTAKWIMIAKYLRQLNNYNCLMAIIAGLNNSAVIRLKITFREIPKRYLDIFLELGDLMKSELSYKAYREAIHNSDPPCLPYLGVYLSDLTFIEDGNPNMYNGLINFRKRRLVCAVIQEIQQYQLKPYHFLKVPDIQNELNSIPLNDAKLLYDLSLVREPRGQSEATDKVTFHRLMRTASDIAFDYKEKAVKAKDAVSEFAIAMKEKQLEKQNPNT